MTAPMAGSWTVRVHEVRPFSIHGDLYYELHVTRTDAGGVAGQLLALRIPQHALDAAPSPGDQLQVSFLLGQVTSAKPMGQA